MASRTPGLAVAQPGLVSNYHAQPARAAIVAHHRLVQDVQDGKRSFMKKEDALSKLRDEDTSARVNMHNLQLEAQALADELASLDRDSLMPTAERMAKAAAVRANQNVNQQAIELHSKHANKIHSAVVSAEHELLLFESDLARKVEKLDEANAAERARLEQQRSVAAARINNEGRHSEALADRLLNRTVGRLEEDVRAMDRGLDGHDLARTNHAAAASVLARTRAERDEVRVTAAQLEKEEIDRRMSAILSLKHNIEQVQSDIQSANARRAAARAAKDAAHAAEYHELLAAKQNPYEVWRARERDAKVEKAVKDHASRVAEEKLRVAGDTIAEDMKLLPLERRAQEEKELEETIRKSKLPVRRQAATQAYIMSKTIGNVPVLDPTGRAIRIEPSTVTAFKPPWFGLGNTALTRADVLAKLAAKPSNADIMPLQQWLPKDVAAEADAVAQLDRDLDEIDDSAGAGYGDVAGAGRDPYGPSGGYGSAEEEGAADGRYSPNGLGGAGAGAGGVVDPYAAKAKKYPQRQLSVYEQRLMAAARERQRTSLVRQQVAAGREYKGAGFECKPGVIHFKDFTVGQPYVINVKLTNTSFTFNFFKVLKLPDAICDLFASDLAPPGRMSAGTSVSFNLTFIPRKNEDINATYEILAQTGPISIPLLCTTTKALPLVKQPVLDTGTVTLGEHKTVGFVLENEGVLPLKVTVQRLSDAQAYAAGEGGDGAYDEGKSSEGKAGDDTSRPDGSSHEPWRLTHGTTYQLGGYTSITIPVKFCPMTAGPAAAPLRLLFDRPECQPIDLLARGAGLDVPLYVEEEVLDLYTCLTGKLYRATVTVHNRGTIALKCSPRLPAGFLTNVAASGFALGSHVPTGELEFHPTLGYVQARDPITGKPGTYTFQLRFRPTNEMLARPLVNDMIQQENVPSIDVEGKHAEDGHHDQTTYPPSIALAPLLRIPLQITAPDQVLPVDFAVQARVTSPDLTFEPQEFDFGSCPMGQAVSRPVTVTNSSALPIKYGFIKPPRGFHVGPGEGDGFGLLLPGESTEMRLVFQPTVAAAYDTVLTCNTNTVGSYRLYVRGQGQLPVLTLSHPCCFLAATCVGEVETAFVHLTNTSRVEQDYHIVPPQTDLPLEVAPAVGRIGPGQTVRLQIRYAPSEGYYQTGLAEQRHNPRPLQIAAEHLGVQLGPDGQPLEADDSVEAGGSVTLARMLLQEAAPSAVHRVYQLPVFARPAAAAGNVATVRFEGANGSNTARSGNTARSRSPGRGNAGEAEPPLLQQAVVLQVSATALPRLVSVDKRTLAFGQAPVGRGSELTVRVANHSELALELVPGPLNPAGAFSYVNAPRLLAPHGTHDVIVQFKPTGHKFFTDRLVLGSKGHGPLAEIILTGEGVSPSIAIEPAGAGTIDFGNLITGDSATRQLKLRNSSQFPLSFKMVDESHMVTAGSGHVLSQAAALAALSASPVPLFGVEPWTGSVPPGGTVTINVTYNPRHAPPGGLPHRARFLIDVPNQDPHAMQHLVLSGRCWDRAAFVLPALASEDIKAESVSAVDTHLVEAAIAAPAPGLGSPGRPAAGSKPGAAANGSGELYVLTFHRDDEGSHEAALGTARSPSRPSSAANGKGGAAAAAGAAPVAGPPAMVPKEVLVSCINRAEYNKALDTATAGVTGTPSRPPSAANKAAAAGAAAAAGGAPANVVQSPASYEVYLPAVMVTAAGSRPHYFSVEAPTGSVAPGAKAAIKFKFAPPAEKTVIPIVNGKPAALTVGEWQEVDATVTVNGGYVPTGSAASKTITVRLRGFVANK